MFDTVRHLEELLRPSWQQQQLQVAAECVGEP
jgi:hypothetical protein